MSNFIEGLMRVGHYMRRHALPRAFLHDHPGNLMRGAIHVGICVGIDCQSLARTAVHQGAITVFSGIVRFDSRDVSQAGPPIQAHGE